MSFLKVSATCASVFYFCSTGAAYADEIVHYGDVPSWVVDKGDTFSKNANKDGILIFDRQHKIEKDQSVNYTDIAIHATSIEQLTGLGNIVFAWHPDKGNLTVHRLHIIRGDEIIDVTKGTTKFTILRREQNLERLAISGILTATMQVEGLKVGDILRLTTSVGFKDAAMAGNIEVTQPLLPDSTKVASGRLRVIWPMAQALKWRMTIPDTPFTLEKKGGFNELSIVQPLGKRPDLPTDAPLRFTPPPLFEASSFATWSDVSKTTAAHYATDGLIAPQSALGERVAKIAAGTTDPKMRVAAALRLVQDEVRYLFNGQTQGNYVPQTPAETWEKRYGDCKAKTLLLVSILRQLGIAAEPALVHSQLGDLLPTRLPSMGAFDHILVRAVIEGKIYWLDGTGLGTRLADLGDTPPFRYALPVRLQGSELEAIAYIAPARPLVKLASVIDASAGVALPKTYKIQIELHNNQVAQLRQAQSVLEKKQLDEQLDQIVTTYMGESIVTKKSLRFDDDAGTAIITGEGITNAAWNNEGGVRKYQQSTIFSDFVLNSDRNRAAWSNMAVNTSPPNHYESTRRLILPIGGKGFILENPKSVSGQFAGYDMKVSMTLQGGVFDVAEQWKTASLEIAAADLAAEREKLARAKSQEVSIVAPSDYAPAWREQRQARGSAMLKPLESLYAANIAQNPDVAWAYINRARYLAGIGDKAGAIVDLTKVIAIEPDVDTYLWRSRLLMPGDAKRALADVEAARAIDPASPDAIGRLVDIYTVQRRYDDALTEIDRVLPLQSEQTDLLVLKAETLARAGRGAEALDVINKANLDKPGNPVLLNGRCWVKAIANLELDTALKDCTKAIELSDTPAGILDSRGVAYLRMKRYDDAIADFDAAIAINPGQSQTLYVRGVAKTLSGANAAGIADIKDAVLIQPDIAEGYDRMGISPKL